MKSAIMRLLGLLAATATLLALAACNPLTGSDRELTAADAGSSVELRVGEIVDVKLRGNPTTGFEWDSESLDTAVLVQNGDAKFTPDSGATGSGGEVVTSFKAVAPGQTQLKLIYQRPWLKDQPPSDTFEVTVVVK